MPTINAIAVKRTCVIAIYVVNECVYTVFPVPHDKSELFPVTNHIELTRKSVYSHLYTPIRINRHLPLLRVAAADADAVAAAADAHAHFTHLF